MLDPPSGVSFAIASLVALAPFKDLVPLAGLRVKRRPVGRRRIVCSSVVLSRFWRTVPPVPPSNAMLSGTTTAARPVVLQ